MLPIAPNLLGKGTSFDVTWVYPRELLVEESDIVEDDLDQKKEA
jgi:hypothetical protein